ncbi:uncharacterized protein LOC116222839 [Clupea harengus]|uniref:Uncharacterized protein LOC116222839 n=1 Tax=Clupea harengus TaxID=7950 RepID=A0A6P8G344_CLUHA|nr:uncharacterized protein LOC116222839 [Clupea harengus]
MTKFHSRAQVIQMLYDSDEESDSLSECLSDDPSRGASMDSFEWMCFEERLDPLLDFVSSEAPMSAPVPSPLPTHRSSPDLPGPSSLLLSPRRTSTRKSARLSAKRSVSQSLKRSASQSFKKRAPTRTAMASKMTKADSRAPVLQMLYDSDAEFDSLSECSSECLSDDPWSSMDSFEWMCFEKRLDPILDFVSSEAPMSAPVPSPLPTHRSSPDLPGPSSLLPSPRRTSTRKSARLSVKRSARLSVNRSASQSFKKRAPTRTAMASKMKTYSPAQVIQMLNDSDEESSDLPGPSSLSPSPRRTSTRKSARLSVKKSAKPSVKNSRL